MAGIGALSNANFHMFEPSPIETQLATIDPVKNPQAAALLGGYQAERRMAQDDYGAQLDWTRQQQLAEFQQKSQSDLRTQLASVLKEAATPGAAQAARTAGLLPSSVDTSGLEAGGLAAAKAKNMGEAGAGLGKLADANVNVQPQLSDMLPGATQGPNARIASAQIIANSHIAAAGLRAAGAVNAANAANMPHNTIDIPLPGGGSMKVASSKNNGAIDMEGALRAQGIPEGSPLWKRAMLGLQPPPGSTPSAGMTQLQPAQSDLADVAPFANNTPPKPAAKPTGTVLDGPAGPAPAAPLPANSATAPTADPRAQALLHFQQSNPQAWADVSARVRAKQPAFEAQGNQMMLVGASGQRYPLQ